MAAAALDVPEDPVDGPGIRDHGDDLQVGPAAGADLRIHLEHFPQNSCPARSAGLRESVVLVGSGGGTFRGGPGWIGLPDDVSLPDAGGVSAQVADGVRSGVGDLVGECVNELEGIENPDIAAGPGIRGCGDEHLSLGSE